LTRLASEFAAKGEKDRAKLERMMLYGQSAACRWRLLREYFGEEESAGCGHCDNCLNPIEQQLQAEQAGKRIGVGTI
jgi:ATP-dependent DNA helicase RecQ